MAEDPGARASEADRLELSEEAWRARLTPEQYHILRDRGTDRPFAGAYTHPAARGRYRCAGCGAELFDAGTQFDSGSGWPSFTEPVSPDRVELREDRSHGMTRIEVSCRRCGGHLGHLFDDGPAPRNERWCINSTSLAAEHERG